MSLTAASIAKPVMRNMPETMQEHDDFSATRRVVDILQPFRLDAQRRILRWVAEKLRTGDLDGSRFGYDVNRDVGEGLASYEAVLRRNGPANDKVFAAAVAFAEHSCAPHGFQKEHVTAEALRAAARKIERHGPKHPAQTLINAEAEGLLRKIGRGRYGLTPKGRKAFEQNLQTGTEPNQRRGAAKGGKVPAKYRNPANAAEVWSGRGLRPGWVKAALGNGHALDDLRIRS
jgi:DNA-binding protein H-NS